MLNTLPTPHGDKLNALLQNSKLPITDKPQVEAAINHYHQWRSTLNNSKGPQEIIVEQMVGALNTYKRYIELDLIFDSKNDFLYRQKGQLKLDNTIIEEFLPILVTKALPTELSQLNLEFGPTTCFSGLYFESSLSQEQSGGGIILRQKDHDFAISRKLYLRSSHNPDLSDGITKETHIAYVATECKTNLDKTMFQEAAATALDVKLTVPNAKYYLLCEWLDMRPINTSTTAIDEIIILRRAKRVSSNIRSQYNTYPGRQKNRQDFIAYLDANPISIEGFNRFVAHISRLIDEIKKMS